MAPLDTILPPAALDLLRRQPLSLVDIGARFGLPPHWAAVSAVLDVVAFEPDPDEARRLEQSYRRSGALAEVVEAAVWDSPGRHVLHVTRNPGCSSLFRPRADFLSKFPEAERFDVVSQLDVETTTLDRVLSARAPRRCRFIKLDAQGGGLPILCGASESLRSVIGLEVEVELAPMYEGEPLFGEVDAHLRRAGFDLVDLRPTYWRRKAAQRVAGTRGQLIFADALYMVSPEALAEHLAQSDEGDVLQACASTLAICAVYGLADWMAAYREAWRHLPAAQTLDAALPATSKVSARAAWRQRAGHALKDLGDRLIESSSDWAVAEQRLGNKRRLNQSISGWLARQLGWSSK
ncbi:MAG: hypothetical protein AMXMBFR57_16590 [Acidimicrobiia bacterium]